MPFVVILPETAAELFDSLPVGPVFALVYSIQLTFGVRCLFRTFSAPSIRLSVDMWRATSCLLSFPLCNRPEAASDVISGLMVDDFGMDMLYV